MPATFCIPKSVSDQIKVAIKQGIITAEKLYGMTAKDRKDLFSRYMGPDGGGEIASRFEEEMTTRQLRGINRWINRQTEGIKQARDAAEELTRQGVIDAKKSEPALRAIVEQRHGVALTPEQIKTIADQATVVQDVYASSVMQDGKPSLEYWKEKSKLDSVMGSLDPNAGTKKRALSQLSKGGLLTGFPSVGKAAFSQFVQTQLGKIDRRLSLTVDPLTKETLQKEGSLTAIRVLKGLNNDSVKSDVASDMKVYYETGYMPAKGVDSVPTWQGIGEKSIGVSGDSLTSRAARFQNDYVMKYGHGLAHAVTYTHTFYDELNIASTKMSLATGRVGEEAVSYARDIYNDAKSGTPTTNEGIALRAQAQSEAAYRANIDNSDTAKSVQHLKAAIAAVAGNNVADVLMPIVRVGANAADKSIKFTVNVNGGYAIKALVSGIQRIRLGETPEGIAEISKGLVKQGVASAAVIALAYGIGPENYQGVPLSRQERDLMVARGAKPNSVKIGNQWISLGYFQMLAPELSGTLSAMQNPGGALSKASSFVKGITTQIGEEIPGANTVTTYAEDLFGTGSGIKNDIEYATTDALNSLYSRVVPSIVAYAAKAGDPYARVTTGGTLDYIKSEIPGLRETLPTQKSETGDVVPQNQIEQFLFGSTVVPDTSNNVTRELHRIGSKGYPVDLVKPESESRFTNLKEQKGEEVYQKAVEEYSTVLNQKVNQLIESPYYKSSTLDKKKKALEEVHTSVVNQVTDKYGYQKPQAALVSDK